MPEEGGSLVGAANNANDDERHNMNGGAKASSKDDEDTDTTSYMVQDQTTTLPAADPLPSDDKRNDANATDLSVADELFNQISVSSNPDEGMDPPVSAPAVLPPPPPPPPPPPAPFDDLFQQYHVCYQHAYSSLFSLSRADNASSSQSETTRAVVRLVQGVDDLIGLVEELGRAREEEITVHDGLAAGEEGGGRVDVRMEIVQHCSTKAESLAAEALDVLVGQSSEPPASSGVASSPTRGSKKSGVMDCSADGQAAIARVIELNLSMCCKCGSDLAERAETIAARYTRYQVKTLRSRSKAAIANVVRIRDLAKERGCPLTDLIRPSDSDGADDVGYDGEDGEDGMTAEEKKLASQPHGQTITVILGEASSLIHPLAMWRNGMPDTHSNNPADNSSSIRRMCDDTIAKLDGEAQTLANTVGGWFLEDHLISKWEEMGLQRSAPGGGKDRDLVTLDRTIEEMSYLCQVMSRYLAFVGAERDSALSLHLSELSLRYSTLETTLLQSNYDNALAIAKPIEIVLGKGVYVPSVVEDSYYLGQNGVERAIGTRSERAVYTIAHHVCELWNPTMGEGIYKALVDGIGCDVNLAAIHAESSPAHHTTIPTSRGSGGGKGFTGAFLAAFDDDLGAPSTPPPRSASSRGPRTGGYYSTKRTRSTEEHVLSQLCALNGMHSASAACASLSELFASYLEEGDGADPSASSSSSVSMIQTAREELLGYSRAYQSLLTDQAKQMLANWCGTVDLNDPPRVSLDPLPRMHKFLLAEQYELDSSAFSKAENEDRIEAGLLEALRECPLIRDITQGKADGDVALTVAKELSSQVVDVVLGTILRERKRFTDWGALLFSKEVRCLQDMMCVVVSGESGSGRGGSGGDDGGMAEDDLISTVPILDTLERLNQATTILQLERPADWSTMAYAVGGSGDNDGGGKGKNLTPDEIQSIMLLRVDFSKEAVASVCAGLKS